MKLQITIDGKAYEVEVEVLDEDESPETPTHPAYQAISVTSGSHASSHIGSWDSSGKICRSPLAGVVVKVNVEIGQSVESGDLLMVLEAMKMETSIAAPRAAIVKSIHVAQGNPVKLNQILLELE